MNQQEDGSTGA